MMKKRFFTDIEDEIIGIDEVGRGALCGPVVSCAVLLNKTIISDNLFLEIDDSKKLSEAKRNSIACFLKENSKFSFGLATHKEIDTINILKATNLSMKRAFNYFKKFPNKIKIDGIETFFLNNRTEFIVKGDKKSVTIAAASILAKNYRDEIMKKYSIDFPEYKWEKNKGYGTKEHLLALKNFGLSPIHRKSFAPVKNLAL